MKSSLPPPRTLNDSHIFEPDVEKQTYKIKSRLMMFKTKKMNAAASQSRGRLGLYEPQPIVIKSNTTDTTCCIIFLC